MSPLYFGCNYQYRLEMYAFKLATTGRRVALLFSVRSGLFKTLLSKPNNYVATCVYIVTQGLLSGCSLYSSACWMKHVYMVNFPMVPSFRLVFGRCFSYRCVPLEAIFSFCFQVDLYLHAVWVVIFIPQISYSS